jgi:hypothetical protein
MKEGSDPLMNSALAMFVSNTNKPTTRSYGTSSYGNPSYNRERGRNSFQTPPSILRIFLFILHTIEGLLLFGIEDLLELLDINGRTKRSFTYHARSS